MTWFYSYTEPNVSIRYWAGAEDDSRELTGQRYSHHSEGQSHHVACSWWYKVQNHTEQNSFFLMNEVKDTSWLFRWWGWWWWRTEKNYSSMFCAKAGGEEVLKFYVITFDKHVTLEAFRASKLHASVLIGYTQANGPRVFIKSSQFTNTKRQTFCSNRYYWRISEHERM